MRDEIKISENNQLDVLISVSKNSSNEGYVSPESRLMPAGKKRNTVQSTSRGLESGRENLDLIDPLIIAHLFPQNFYLNES